MRACLAVWALLSVLLVRTSKAEWTPEKLTKLLKERWRPEDMTGPSDEEYMRRWIIELKSKPNKKAVSYLVKLLGGKIINKLKVIDGMAIDLPLKLSDMVKSSNILNRLSEHSSVKFIEKDEVRYPLSELMPYGVDMVQSTKVWYYSKENWSAGRGIRVCVIDGGLDRTHEEFEEAQIVNSNPYSEWGYDGCNHGNHVAGTIRAQTFNNKGVVSVAPYSELYIVRVFSGENCGYAWSSGLTGAMEKCWQNNADIISMSLGGRWGLHSENDMINALYNHHKTLVVASAGNTGDSSFQYPASYDNVISVGAVDYYKRRPSFSTHNSKVDLVAPGVSVLSTVTGADGKSAYQHLSGTSMAAPHVSGVAALIWSRATKLSPSEIRYCLQSTAEDLGSVGRDDYYGHGLVRALNAHECALAMNSQKS